MQKNPESPKRQVLRHVCGGLSRGGGGKTHPDHGQHRSIGGGHGLGKMEKMN